MAILIQCIVDYNQKYSKIPSEFHKSRDDVMGLILNYSKKKLRLLKRSEELTKLLLYYLASPTTLEMVTKGSNEEELVHCFKVQMRSIKMI
mmetsp:Transcript_20303/g.17976  ORF Transcript_20303/g.17976 Transcript_20303/m.17976 type:complete len:91 (-) Transcript_20303:50-322(-)